MVGFRNLRLVSLASREAYYVIPAIFVIELIGLTRNECDLRIHDIVSCLSVRLFPCAPFNRAEWSYLVKCPLVGMFPGRNIYARSMHGHRRKVPMGKGEKEGTKVKYIYLRTILSSVRCHSPLPHNR